MALTNATVDTQDSHSEGALFVERITLSGLSSALQANIPHKGPVSVAPNSFHFEATTQPTDGSSFRFVYDNSDTTNDEVDITFWSETGGSLTGMIGVLVLKWLEVAPQDRSSIASDNDGAS